MPQRIMLEFLMRLLMLSFIKKTIICMRLCCGVMGDQESIMNITTMVYMTNKRACRIAISVSSASQFLIIVWSTI